MTTTLPENMSYGRVVGRFLHAIGDGPADVDEFPDGLPAQGTVTFTPSAAWLLDLSAAPVPVTVYPGPITCTLDAEGYLVGPQATRGVWLVSTDDPDLNPTGWTYNVTVSILGKGTRSFSIAVPAGSEQDLTTLTPVAAAGGVPVIRGEKGDTGATGAIGPQGPPGEVSEAELAAAVDAAMGEHEAAVDPHPQYLTLAEAGTSYVSRATRPQHAPALGVYFPEAEGAVGDGAANDQPAWNAALLAAAGKGKVYGDPSKTYALGTHVTVPALSHIVGGNFRCLASSVSRAFLVQNVSDVVIEEVVIDLNKAATTNQANVNQQQGIYLSATTATMSRIRIERVTVKNGWQRGIHAAATSPHAFTDVTVDRCIVTDCGDNGIQLSAQGQADKTPSLSRRIKVTDCTLRNHGNVGIQVTGMSFVDVVGNVVDGGGVSAQSGIVFSSSGTNSHVTDFVCSGNKVTGHTSALRWGIVASVDCTRFVITGNEVRGCTGGITVDPENGAALGVRVDVSAAVSGNVITGSVGSTASHGINARMCEHLAVSGNVSKGNAGSGIALSNAYACSIIANTCNANGVYGVAVQGTNAGTGGHHVGPNAAQGNTSGASSFSATPIANTVYA